MRGATLLLGCASAALAFGPSSARPVVAPRLTCGRAPAPLLADRSAHAVACAPLETPETPPTTALTLAPIWLAVLVQMLGVGVTLSTLPLYLHALGCSANQQALCISGFSACQMLGCPLLVALSGRVGRLAVLRACLAGNAVASLLTASASGLRGIFFARCLAGLTAASVPVAQVAVAEVCPPGPATSTALSRVASAASIGIIAGPGFAALIAELGRRVSVVGDSAVVASRLVFLASGVFAVAVLLLTGRVRLQTPTPTATPPPPLPTAVAAAAPSAGVAPLTAKQEA